MRGDGRVSSSRDQDTSSGSLRQKTRSLPDDRCNVHRSAASAAQEFRTSEVLPIVVTSEWSGVAHDEARVVGLAIAVALETAGFLVPYEPLIRDQRPRSPVIGSLAPRVECDAVLIAEFWKSGERMWFAMEWYDHSAATPLYSISSSAPMDYQMDHQMDRPIKTAVDAILRSVDRNLSRSQTCRSPARGWTAPSEAERSPSPRE